MAVRVDQLSAETLAKSAAAAQIDLTKISLKVLADPVPEELHDCPCDHYDRRPPDGLMVQTHRLAKCWEWTRLDGTTYRFTEHDKSLVVGGNTFVPTQGMDATAQQRLAGLESGNYEAFGVVGGVSFVDLVSGLFRGSRLTELVVDWRYPFLGCFRCQTHWVRRLSFDGEKWEADMTGQRGRLNKPAGRFDTRGCDFILGEPTTCGAVLAVEEGIEVTAVDATLTRTKFTAPATALGGATINGSTWYTFGNITWKSGANVDRSFEVRLWDDTTDEWQLYLETPDPINVGDTFDATGGCDHTPIQCLHKFHNWDRYGGAPFMVGPDAVVRGPGVTFEQLIFDLISLVVPFL